MIEKIDSYKTPEEIDDSILDMYKTAIDSEEKGIKGEYNSKDGLTNDQYAKPDNRYYQVRVDKVEKGFKEITPIPDAIANKLGYEIIKVAVSRGGDDKFAIWSASEWWEKNGKPDGIFFLEQENYRQIKRHGESDLRVFDAVIYKLEKLPKQSK